MNKLRELRILKGKSMKEVGDALHISESTLSRMENGLREPKESTLKQFAEYYGVTSDYIMGRDSKKPPQINVYASVRAGHPVDMDNDIVDTVDITRKMAETGEYFGVYVKGDSMMPKFEEGDLLVVRKQESVENGEIAVVAINNEEATVKKVKYIADKIQLIPFNIQYEPMEYSADEVTIIGKVIEVRRSL